MTNALTVAQPLAIMPSQANSDQHLIALWLHGKSPHTQRAYKADVQRLLDHVDNKPLPSITLTDLQSFADSLSHLSTNSAKRKINAVKSLLTFGQKLGYLQFNVGAAMNAPKAKNTLAERILTEAEVHSMIALTKKNRDKVLLRLLYASAGRVSEICTLKWRDVRSSGERGQVTLFGKGAKTRAVVVSNATWQALQSLRGARLDDEAVFRSQKGGALAPSQVWRIVRAAAKRAGIAGHVSPHWFRHSHASHALERGASVALVRDTLGHSSLAVTSMYTHARPTESSALHLAI